MGVIIDGNDAPYCLLVDSVETVMRLEKTTWQHSPLSVNDKWASIASGVHHLEHSFLVIVDIEKLLYFPTKTAA